MTFRKLKLLLGHMNTPILFGILRHVLTLIAGGLATRGVIAESETEIAVGAITALVGIVLSAIDKKRNQL